MADDFIVDRPTATIRCILRKKTVWSKIGYLNKDNWGTCEER